MFHNAWSVALVLWPILSFAGGLGFAALIGLLALTAIAERPSIKLARYGGPLMLAFAFALVSYAWSPWDGRILEFDMANGKYAVKSSPLRLALVGLAATFVAAIVGGLSGKSRLTLSNRTRWAIWVMIAIIVVTAVFEDQMIALFAPLSSEPAETVQNIGRNAMLTAAAAPLALFAAADRGGRWVWMAGVAALGLLASAVSLGFYAAALALVAAAVAAIWVRLAPQRGFAFLGYASAAWLVATPAVAWLALDARNGAETAASADIASALWRLDMWRLAADLIAQKPLFGWGADAARTIDVVYTQGPLAGELILSGHPHNMALHIWLELGAVGALLVAGALALFGRALPTPAALGAPTAMAAAGVWGACLAVASVSFSVWNAGWWAFVLLLAAAVSLSAGTGEGRR